MVVAARPTGSLFFFSSSSRRSIYRSIDPSIHHIVASFSHPNQINPYHDHHITKGLSSPIGSYSIAIIPSFLPTLQLVPCLIHIGNSFFSSFTARIVSVPVPVQTRVVVGVSLRAEQVTEHSTKVSNVRLCLELERAAVRQVLSELRGASLTQGGDGDGLLLFHNQLVLLGGGLSLESLPRKSSLEEVYENVSNGLEVIASGLLHAQVIVDGCVTRSTRQGASFTLGNVLQSSRVAVSLGETKVDAVDEVSVAASAVRDKVGGLDIAVDQVARVHELHTLQHLIGHHEDRLERESTTALVELILQRGSQQVHHHEVVLREAMMERRGERHICRHACVQA